MYHHHIGYITKIDPPKKKPITCKVKKFCGVYLSVYYVEVLRDILNT